MSSDLATPTEESCHGVRGALRFDRFATLVIYVVTFALGATSAAQTDLWWLLRAGEDIWHTGRVPLVDHYSFTAAGRYWPNHEWLWEAVAYALHHIGGMPLLSAWTGATVALTAWIMRRSSRATGYVVPIVLGAVLPLMSITWTVRPQVTSQLLFAVTLLLLIRERYLWVPPVFLVWANLHAQVITGLVVLGAVFVSSVVHAARRGSPDATRRLRHVGVTLLASALATLVTPLGLRLWGYVLGANRRPGEGQIIEWATVFHSLLGAISVPALLLLVAAVAVWRRDRIAGWEASVPVVGTIATAPLAVLAVRNIPFLVVAVVPLLMTLLEFRSPEPIGIVTRGRETVVALGVVVAAAVTAVWVATPPRLAWHPVPPALATALHHCPGPLYNDYNDGAALVWFVPDVKVFVDNRQDPYPASVIDASMGLPPEDYRRTFDRFGIQCALLDRDSALTPALQHDGWTPLYDDGASVVLAPPRATSATE